MYLCGQIKYAYLKSITIMNNFLKYLGVIIVLLGVACLGAYEAYPSNMLLLGSLVLEFVGILTFILINRFVD